MHARVNYVQHLEVAIVKTLKARNDGKVFINFFHFCLIIETGFWTGGNRTIGSPIDMWSRLIKQGKYSTNQLIISLSLSSKNQLSLIPLPTLILRSPAYFLMYPYL